MGGAVMNIFQQIARVIAELNDKFYLNFDIRTYISWLGVVMMYLLYRILTQYVLKPAPVRGPVQPAPQPPIPPKLSSIDLVKLLAIYFVFLGFFFVSYVDLQVVKANNNYQFMLMLLTFIIGLIIVLVALFGEAVQKNRKLILLTLYAPIFLLVISNGRIFEERFGTFNSVLPRSEFSFINLPSEIEKVCVGGSINTRDVEDIIKQYDAVQQCVVIARRDPKDNFVKLFAYIVVKSIYVPNNALKQKICWFLTGKGLSCFKFPEIKFVKPEELKKIAGEPPNRRALQKKKKNWSEIFPEQPQVEP